MPDDHIIRSSRARLSRSERDAGRGTFVTDAARGGWTFTSEVTVRFEPACERASAELQVPLGEPLTVRDRVMYADGKPVQLAVSRLPRSITEGTAIEQEDTGPGGLYARLEEAGHVISHFQERLSTRLVTADETEQLRMHLGTPVLLVTRIAYGTDGVPLEINDMVMAGDRYELVYELPAD